MEKLKNLDSNISMLFLLNSVLLFTLIIFGNTILPLFIKIIIVIISLTIMIKMYIVKKKLKNFNTFKNDILSTYNDQDGIYSNDYKFYLFFTLVELIIIGMSFKKVNIQLIILIYTGILLGFFTLKSSIDYGNAFNLKNFYKKNMEKLN